MILEADEEISDRLSKAFKNGIVYYCGLCQLAYPPFHQYPMIYTLSNEPTEDEWIAASDFLLSQSVETVFFYSYHINHRAMDYLVDKGVILLGIQEPPQELEDGWATSIRFDFEKEITDFWEKYNSDMDGLIEDVPLQLDHVNEVLFSVGRQRWVDEMLADLLQGLIIPRDPTP